MGLFSVPPEVTNYDYDAEVECDRAIAAVWARAHARHLFAPARGPAAFPPTSLAPKTEYLCDLFGPIRDPPSRPKRDREYTPEPECERAAKRMRVHSPAPAPEPEPELEYESEYESEPEPAPKPKPRESRLAEIRATVRSRIHTMTLPQLRYIGYDYSFKHSDDSARRRMLDRIAEIGALPVVLRSFRIQSFHSPTSANYAHIEKDRAYIEDILAR